ncbi:hypothetical protein MIND_00417800 [Mycena indigotica]|uniref:Uncharacterized protein n=1 Tax=Mycena indigotica TaxID=2126181 RepID=A0A8H6W590_9AGAR|nr:uncharacterized protein MIND_00417800 [Mycena indigotica]KAF7306269.1 hypothetical protein MIND_00417800 [Mycena indigotica]
MAFSLVSPEYSAIFDAVAKRSAGLTDVDEAEERRIELEEREIEDDLEGEQEAFGFPNLDEVERESLREEMDDEDSDGDMDMDVDDQIHNFSNLPSKANAGPINVGDMKKVIAEASKGVIEATDATYRRLITQCEKFMQEKGFISQGKSFFSPTPSSDAPAFIIAWIMTECDDIELDGTSKPATKVRASYSHAQKMRAAATYGFGRVADLGSRPWEQVETFDAGVRKWRYAGNPSVSESVSRYMVTLRKKKVRAGEVATSARAITPDMLYKLYHYNNQPEIAQINPVTRKSRNKSNIDNWCGGRTRAMLHAVYVLAFLCLLRFDEALKIQHQDIKRLDEHSFEVTLPFRKTSQYGDIKPFVLHERPEEEAHLCPVRALACWLMVNEHDDGYLFPNITKRDQIGAPSSPMVF